MLYLSCFIYTTYPFTYDDGVFTIYLSFFCEMIFPEDVYSQ